MNSEDIITVGDSMRITVYVEITHIKFSIILVQEDITHTNEDIKGGSYIHEEGAVFWAGKWKALMRESLYHSGISSKLRQQVNNWREIYPQRATQWVL